MIYKIRQEVMELLLEVDQPNIPLSFPLMVSYPYTFEYSAIVRVVVGFEVNRIYGGRGLVRFRKYDNRKLDTHARNINREMAFGIKAGRLLGKSYSFQANSARRAE